MPAIAGCSADGVHAEQGPGHLAAPADKGGSQENKSWAAAWARGSAAGAGGPGQVCAQAGVGAREMCDRWGHGPSLREDGGRFLVIASAQNHAGNLLAGAVCEAMTF